MSNWIPQNNTTLMNNVVKTLSELDVQNPFYIRQILKSMNRFKIVCKKKEWEKEWNASWNASAFYLWITGISAIRKIDFEDKVFFKSYNMSPTAYSTNFEVIDGIACLNQWYSSTKQDNKITYILKDIPTNDEWVVLKNNLLNVPTWFFIKDYLNLQNESLKAFASNLKLSLTKMLYFSDMGDEGDLLRNRLRNVLKDTDYDGIYVINGNNRDKMNIFSKENLVKIDVPLEGMSYLDIIDNVDEKIGCAIGYEADINSKKERKITGESEQDKIEILLAKYNFKMWLENAVIEMNEKWGNHFELKDISDIINDMKQEKENKQVEEVENASPNEKI